MALTRVKYVEVYGSRSEHEIQQLLDQMAADQYELFQIVPNIDDRRGNPSVTAGMYLFFRQVAFESHSEALRAA